MTVQELIEVLSKYKPSALVRIVNDRKIYRIKSVKPTVDMDTNVVEATIWTEENT